MAISARAALRPDESAPRAARRALRVRLNGLRRVALRLGDLLDGDDPAVAAAGVHQLRVAARRTEAALLALRPLCDAEAWRKVRVRVRRLRRVAGAVRDADVHAQALREVLAKADASLKAALEQAIARTSEERERDARVLRRAIRGRLDLLDKAAARRVIDRGAAAAVTVMSLGRRALADAAVPLVTASQEDLASLERLHEVRLNVKRLRYAMESFAGVLPDAARADAMALLEEAQQAFGEVNDVHQLVLRLGRLEGDAPPLAVLRARFEQVLAARHERARQWWAGKDLRSLKALLEAPPLPQPETPTGQDSSGGVPMVRAGGDVPSVFDRTPQRSLFLSGERLAAIDIGSNSIRMLVVELLDERSWRVLSEERAMTRLAHGLAESRMLAPEAMAASVEGVVRFKASCDRLGVRVVRAFATAAVREARNGKDFISLVHDRTGLRIEVVSDLDEGKLVHRSVARGYDLAHGPAAVADLGGGSLEVVQSINGVITGNTSMPLGAVRLTEAFGGAIEAAGASYKALRRHVERVLEERVRVPETPPALLVGCGGTFTTLLTLSAAARGVMIDRNSPALTTLGPVSRVELKALVKRLRETPLEQRLRFPGLPSDRADIIVAGLTVVERLMRRLGVAHVHVHPGGVREGLILRMVDDELARRARGAVVEQDPAVVLAGVRAFAKKCRYPRAHSEQVARLAVSLYDQFLGESNQIRGLGGDRHERVLLEAGCVLHDVGMLVEYARHHKHGHAMVLHADLPGLTAREIEIVAALVRYHRRAEPSEAHAEYAALSDADKALVNRLAAILRVADGLDRAHVQAVRSVTLRQGNREVILSVEASADATPDVEAAMSKRGMLEEVLGFKVRVEAMPPGLGLMESSEPEVMTERAEEEEGGAGEDGHEERDAAEGEA